MILGDKIRDMLRTFLKIEPAQPQAFSIEEQLDFAGSAFKHRLWYRGSSTELEQFYGQLRDRTCPFWGAVASAGLGSRKIHTGLPKEIVKLLADIVLRDLNAVELADVARQDVWDAISKENRMPTLLKRAVRDTLVVGDGAFKVSLDPMLSKYPIVEWYAGDSVEIKQERGRLDEVIFLNHYTERNRPYTLREHYGRGYVRYELTANDNPVGLDAIDETRGLADVKYDGSWIMAVPFKVQDSDRWPGRGESIFEGKTGNFDALDEAWSQWVHAMREARPTKYIPENLVPRDPITGVLMRPNPFDNRFIQIGSHLIEGVPEEIKLIQAAFNAGEYSLTLNSALDFALQGLISPSTLGIDVKKMDNAEAQREKEKATLYSRNNIIDALSDALAALIDVVFKAYDTAMKAPIEDTEATITFGEYANPSFEAVVEVMSNPNTPMSIEAKVDELWGDSKDEAWKTEEVARVKEQLGIATMEEPGVGVEPVPPGGMIDG